MATGLLSRAAMLLGGSGLVLSLGMISRLALSERRVRLEAEQRFEAHGAAAGAMVAVPPTISVARFFLDETEVTVAAYRACVDDGSCTPPSTGGLCNWAAPG